MLERWREVPPTAGLPVKLRDFVGGSSFEDGLADFLDVSRVQIECSGTAALIVALTALKNESRRRRVIVPAYTCPLVVAAILHCGLTPLLCDVRSGHFDFSMAALESIIDSDTLAVIPTHLGGRLADVDSTIDLAHRHGAIVIEDAAQSLGATLRGRMAGTIADIGIYSFAAGKGLTLFEGGALVARDAAMQRLLRAESAPSRPLWELRRVLELAAYAIVYRPSGLRAVYGIPLRRALKKGRLAEAVGDITPRRLPFHRVSALRKKTGSNALLRLPTFLDALNHQAAPRKAKLMDLRDVVVLDDAAGASGTWPLFMVLMLTQRARDAIMTRSWTVGFGVSRIFVHAIPDYPGLGISDAEIPNARDFAALMFTISNSLFLTDPEFQQICSVIEAISA